MKRTLSIVVLFLAVSTTSFAQKEKAEKDENEQEEKTEIKKHLVIPPAVKSAFSKKYPSAKKVTWEREDGNYEGNWGGKSGEDNSVQFTPSGKFIEIVNAIPVNQLPEQATTYVNEHYKGAKITEAGKVTDAKGKLSYEAEINGRDVIFDKAGNFVEAEK